MQIKRPPYPLYYDGTPDYYGTFFCSEIIVQTEEFYINIGINVGFDRDDPIEDLIKDGRASYAVMIECPSTDYKELCLCTDGSKKRIAKAVVSDNVTVTPLVIATETINGYEHPNLTDDFAGSPITIPKGGVLVIDDETNITIERGMPQGVESICRFRKTDGSFNEYDCRGPTIDVFLPEDVFDEYKLMNKAQKTVLTSIYFVPVLMDVIEGYFLIDEPDADYRSNNWYIAIEKRLEQIEDYKGMASYEIAMNILFGLQREAAKYIRQPEVLQ